MKNLFFFFWKMSWLPDNEQRYGSVGLRYRRVCLYLHRPTGSPRHPKPDSVTRSDPAHQRWDPKMERKPMAWPSRGQFCGHKWVGGERWRQLLMDYDYVWDWWVRSSLRGSKVNLRCYAYECCRDCAKQRCDRLDNNSPPSLLCQIPIYSVNTVYNLIKYRSIIILPKLRTK